MAASLSLKVQTPEEMQQLNALKERVEGFVAEIGAVSQKPGDLKLVRECLARWEQRVAETLKEIGMQDEAERLKASSGVRVIADPFGNTARQVEAKESILIGLLEEITAHPDFVVRRLNQSRRPLVTDGDVSKNTQRIFLGHGRSEVWRRAEPLLRDRKLAYEAWESNPRTGKHNIEVLKGLLNSCGFAIIVVTAEDPMSQGGLRARQNVIHEIGLFQGKLGFEKVALLLQEGVEGFTNIDGLQVIQFSESRLEQAFYGLECVLKREKYL